MRKKAKSTLRVLETQLTISNIILKTTNLALEPMVLLIHFSEAVKLSQNPLHLKKK